MLLRLLHVENLTAQRHDRLEVTVSALLGRSACRVTLDEEDLGDRPVAARTVGQLARQTGARQRRLALHGFARLARRMARLCRQHHLAHDRLGILRILLQVIGQRLRNGLIYRCGHLVVAQFGLGLPLELRLGDLHRNDGRKPLAEVVAADVELQLGEHPRIVGVLFERTRQRPAEAREVRTAFDRIDVVDIRMDVLRERIVVLHGHFHRHAVLFGIEIDDRFDDRLAARGVEILHELLQTVFRMEGLAEVTSLLVLHPLVGDRELDTLVQERQFAQAVRQNFVLVLRRMRENLAVGFESDRRTAVRTFADDLQFGGGHALAERLAVDLAVAMHFGDQQRRQCVDARHADAVQTARHLVTALVELTACMEHGQHDLQRRPALLFVVVGRDAAAVVPHGDRTVFVDRHFDIRAIAGQRLVDRVVDHLVYQVMESLLADVADVHGRTLAHGLQPFQHLDARRGILLFRSVHFFTHSYIVKLTYKYTIFLRYLQASGQDRQAFRRVKSAPEAPACRPP